MSPGLRPPATEAALHLGNTLPDTLMRHAKVGSDFSVGFAGQMTFKRLYVEQHPTDMAIGAPIVVEASSDNLWAEIGHVNEVRPDLSDSGPHRHIARLRWRTWTMGQAEAGEA